MLGRQPAHYDAGAAASAGLLGGLLAALVYGLALVGGDAIAGRPMTATLHAWGAALGGGTVAGALAMLGYSTVIGLGFALVSFGWQQASVRWAGLLAGLLAYGVASFVILPVADLTLARAQLALLPVVAASLFGVALGAAVEVLRFRSVERAGHPHRARTVTLRPHTA